MTDEEKAICRHEGEGDAINNDGDTYCAWCAEDDAREEGIRIGREEALKDAGCFEMAYQKGRAEALEEVDKDRRLKMLIFEDFLLSRGVDKKTIQMSRDLFLDYEGLEALKKKEEGK